jgi:hypothetical protein
MGGRRVGELGRRSSDALHHALCCVESPGVSRSVETPDFAVVPYFTMALLYLYGKYYPVEKTATVGLLELALRYSPLNKTNNNNNV